MAPWCGSVFTGVFPEARPPAGVEVPSISQRVRQVPVVQNCLGNFYGKFCTSLSTSVCKEKWRDSSAGESNLVLQQFVTCSEYPILKEMVSLINMVSVPLLDRMQPWGLFVAKHKSFSKDDLTS